MRDYQGLELELDDEGVLLVRIQGQGPMNSLSEDDHAELATIWPDIDADPDVRVVLVTGAGNAFSAGGDLDLERRLAGDHRLIMRIAHETRLLVRNMIDCDKAVVSAINGPAAGAGLAVALLADISVIARDTVIADGHTRIGLAAGDHSVVIWPLLCGMARAKRLLLLSDRIDGASAADIGLVSWATDSDQVLVEARQAASRLSRGSQSAIRGTKRSLNHWLRSAMPAFEASLGVEMLGLFGPDYVEGINAFEEKRPPKFE
jgi:enoyl-CoA hydratase/carnithine racemase